MPDPAPKPAGGAAADAELDRIDLPLRPPAPTLAAHITALDLLAARLDGLPLRERWGARVPVNSKASFVGDIVNTGVVKVQLREGEEKEGRWVEMGAAEAAAWVRRRKAAVLEEHARATEGQAVVPKNESTPAGRILSAKEMAFDPLFAHPAPQEPQPQKQEERSTAPPNPEPALAAPPSVLAPSGAALAGAAAAAGKAGSRIVDADGKEVDLPESLQNLVDLVGEHLHDKLQIPNGDSTVNEAGEPIYEIREDAEGRSLGPVPANGEGSIEVTDRDDDYFSPEAVERRAALRRKIFHEGDSSDEDEDEDEEDMDVDNEEAMDVDDEGTTPKAARPATGLLAQSQPSLTPALDKSTPTTPTQASYNSQSTPPPTVSPQSQRSPAAPPKSILKAPMRKKSVTFDESVPLPPDSPPPKRHGFPLDQMIASTRPIDADGNAMAPKPVPILKAPLPGRKKGPDTFAGLRTGFLSGGPIVPLAPQVESARAVDLSPRESSPAGQASVPVPAAPAGTAPTMAPSPSATVPPAPKAPVTEQVAEKTEADRMDEDPLDAKPKKKSLFAQRRAGPAPNFPKLSESAPMATMKTAVVETPRPANAPPTVGESSSTPSSSEAPMVIVDDDSDPDDYGDLGDFSDSEEDEYALDEALLAREVALDFHRRQAWQKPLDPDEYDPEADPDVVMGIPRVSTITGGEDGGDPLRIVNPTADDLSQFLRVGRGEDGELVFEPPVVHSESESEGDDEDGEMDEEKRERRARRARRKEVMRRLMTGQYDELPPQEEAVAEGLRAEQYEASLPPAVGAVSPTSAAQPPPVAAPPAKPPAVAARDVAERTPAPTRDVAERPSAPPTRDVAERAPAPTKDVVERVAAPVAAEPPAPAKKVSRFKAARMQ